MGTFVIKFWNFVNANPNYKTTDNFFVYNEQTP